MEAHAGGVGSSNEPGRQHGAGRSKVDALKKWIGLGAAILSLGSAVYGTLEYQAEKRARAGEVTELLTSSRSQQVAGDYAAAWGSLQKAAMRMDAGLLVKLFGGLSAEQERLRTAQEDLAMDWLREAKTKVQEGHSYSEVTDQVLGVLSTGAAQSTGTRKADLLAHVGWAYALKESDAASDLKPERFYREAVAIDPTNPYANTFWAYPMVAETSASDAGIAQVKQRFAAALSSSRASGPLRQWVRENELSSMRLWLNYEAAAAAWWLAVDEMHKAGEPIGEQALGDMRSEYLGNEISVEAFGANLSRVAAVVPIADHVELIGTLLQKLNADSRHYLKVILAIALEKAGKPQESLAAWREAKVSDLQPSDEYIGKQVDAAIQRLSTAGAKHS
jgi:hypothetical protein